MITGQSDDDDDEDYENDSFASDTEYTQTQENTARSEPKPQEGFLRFQVRKKDLMGMVDNAKHRKLMSTAILRALRQKESGCPVAIEFHPDPPEKQKKEICNDDLWKNAPSLFERIRTRGPNYVPPKTWKPKPTPFHLKQFSHGKHARAETSSDAGSSIPPRMDVKSELKQILKDLTRAFRRIEPKIYQDKVTLKELQNYFRRQRDEGATFALSDEILVMWFEELDIDGDGALSLNELTGNFHASDLCTRPTTYIVNQVENIMLSTDEYWKMYCKPKHVAPRQQQDPSWDRDDTDKMLRLADEMARKDDFVRQLKDNRHLLRRHVTSTMKTEGGRELQNSRVRDKGKKISNLIGSMAAQRKDLHGSFLHLQKCVDPQGKFFKDLGALKKETEEKEHKQQDDKRKREMAGITSKFKEERERLAQEEQDLMHFQVEVDEEERMLRDLSKQLDFFLPEIENMRDLFYIFDTNRTGLLTRGQLAELMKELRNGSPLAANQLDEIFRAHTVNWKDGLMSLGEFVQFISMHRNKMGSRNSFHQAAIFDYDIEKIRKIKEQLKRRKHNRNNLMKLARKVQLASHTMDPKQAGTSKHF